MLPKEKKKSCPFKIIIIIVHKIKKHSHERGNSKLSTSLIILLFLLLLLVKKKYRNPTRFDNTGVLYTWYVLNIVLFMQYRVANEI